MSEAGSDGAGLAAIENEAHALIERRRYAQARNVVARGLATHPDSSSLQYIGAFVDYAENRHDAAMESVQTLLSRQPDHFGARTLAAHLRVAKRQFPEAEAILVDLLREHPEEPSLYADYADVMLSTLNLDKAQRLAAEGLRHDPEHLGCLQVVALTELIKGGSSSHSEQLERLLRAHPDRAQSLSVLVVALNDRGDHRGALRLARELLRGQPDSEELVRLVRDLQLQNHWSMLPLYPMQRWGWGGAIAVTLAGMVGLRLVGKAVPPEIGGALSILWLSYVVYSWVWPSLLRRFV